MSSALEGLSLKDIHQQLCCYYNATEQVQVARISNIQNWYFERVIFPHEYLLFEAPPSGELEVYQQMDSTPQLLNKLPCDRLQVEVETELKIVC